MVEGLWGGSVWMGPNGPAWQWVHLDGSRWHLEWVLMAPHGDGSRHPLSLCPQRMSCGYVLCTVLLSVAVLLAVTVTGAILFMNHYHTPVTEPPPVISTNPEEANALVTIEKADSSRINIFIDPNCPDPAGSVGRLEGLQGSLLRALAEHDAETKATKGQQKALLLGVADEVAKLVTHAAQLRADCDGLKKGHSAMGQELSALQSEQGRLIQVGVLVSPRHGSCFLCREKLWLGVGGVWS